MNATLARHFLLSGVGLIIGMAYSVPLIGNTVHKNHPKIEKVPTALPSRLASLAELVSKSTDVPSSSLNF
jgi:hypothetical protein